MQSALFSVHVSSFSDISQAACSIYLIIDEAHIE